MQNDLFRGSLQDPPIVAVSYGLSWIRVITYIYFNILLFPISLTSIQLYDPGIMVQFLTKTIILVTYIIEMNWYACTHKHTRLACKKCSTHKMNTHLIKCITLFELAHRRQQEGFYLLMA